VIEPSSKLVAPKSSGGVTATTARSRFTHTTRPSKRISWIGATPPVMVSDCQGGVTWNGRTAR
jgi:hypothetical protein